MQNRGTVDINALKLTRFHVMKPSLIFFIFFLIMGFSASIETVGSLYYVKQDYGMKTERLILCRSRDICERLWTI